MEINAAIASEVIDFIIAETGYKTIVCDTTGTIIAAAEKSRIGSVHSGSQRILRENLSEVSITPEEEIRSAGLVRVGLNLPIIYDSRVIGTYGITGDPTIVRPVAKIAAGLIRNAIEDGETRKIIIEQAKRLKASNSTSTTTVDDQTILNAAHRDLLLVLSEQVSMSIERNRMENDLRASEAKYRRLVEAANIIIVMANDHYELTFMNEYGLNFFGYTHDNIAEKSFKDLLLPEYDSTGRNLWQAFDSAIMNRSESYQRSTIENITRAGKRVWIDWAHRWFVDSANGQQGIVAIGIDVTVAKRAQEEEQKGYQRRRRREVLNEAIFKRVSKQELAEIGEQIGISLSSPFVCLLVPFGEDVLTEGHPVDSITGQQRLDLLVDQLQSSWAGAVWQAQDGIVLLQSMPGDLKIEAYQWALFQSEETMKRLNRYLPGINVRCGIAHTAGRSDNLAGVYYHSVIAATYGPLLSHQPSRNYHYHWKDLGGYQFILRDIHSEQARQFVDDQLGPILRMNRQAIQSELWKTLLELLTHDPADVIAKRLNVHSQTVRYRKVILEKLLGVDLDSLKSKVDLLLATKIVIVTKMKLFNRDYSG